MRLGAFYTLAIFIAASLIGPACAVAQMEDDDLPIATEIPTEGFWPTRLMLERFLDHMVEGARDHYSLDDEQAEEMRALVKARVPAFLTENRAELQTLMNQFVEAQMLGEPPEPAEVAIWSRRALRMSDGVLGLVESVTDEMRVFLSDEQQDKLDTEHAAFTAGFSMMSSKLRVWADGGYDPETDWHSPGPERRRAEREERKRVEEAMDEARVAEQAEQISPESSASAPAKVTDEWAIYTEEFIRRFDLNIEQQNKAVAWLRTRQDERDAYLRRSSAEMDALAQRLEQAKDDEARKAVQVEVDRLTAPVTAMFDDLKRRLETLPTRAQRRAADLRATTQTATSRPISPDRP